MSSRHISNTRDLLNHPGSAGKGDKCRSKLDDSYRKNYDLIDWGRHLARLPENPEEFNPIAHEIV